MAKDRVDPKRGRKPGVVKTSKTSTTNRVFYILIAAVAVAGIAALTYVSTHSNTAVAASPIDSTLPPVQSEGYVMGSPGAPLEVIEFGDFECPVCSRWATLIEPDVRSRLVQAGKIRFRFIDFPIAAHRNTWNASRAAACADEQGKFWEFHDALYATQDQWDGLATSNPDKYFKQELAPRVGLKQDQFNQCVDSKKYQAKIQAHYQLGVTRSVGATPTFIIGNQSIAQMMTWDQFQTTVMLAIAQLPKPVDSGKAATPKPATKAPPKP